MSNLREQMRDAVQKGDVDEVERLTAKSPRALRYLVGLMYQPDENIRKMGAEGIARAARHQPDMVKKIIQRVVWAMNVESNTYAPQAPDVLLAVADENPDLLLPVAGDLIRLSADTSLNQGVCDTLRRIAERCPGKLGRELTRSLNEHLKQGGRRDTRRH